MTKIVVVEIEVEEDNKTIIGEIASDLQHLTILSIGFKKSETTVGNAIHYRTAGSNTKDGLLEATRQAARGQQ